MASKFSLGLTHVGLEAAGEALVSRRLLINPVVRFDPRRH
jgi:hypothetical protein